MNARPNLARIDELGQRLADQAFLERAGKGPAHGVLLMPTSA